MIKFQEKKELDFTSKQIFDLIMDIEKYPQFLHWISGASIVKQYEDHIIAELEIYFKGYKTSYLSEVSTKIDESTYQISIQSRNGPFKSLKNFYVINSVGEKKCSIFFDNSIEFRLKLVQTIVEPVLSKYVQRIILAFEERAGVIYNTKSHN
jgi:coenzyme Q-binding protein COQ10